VTEVMKITVSGIWRAVSENTCTVWQKFLYVMVVFTSYCLATICDFEVQI